MMEPAESKQIQARSPFAELLRRPGCVQILDTLLMNRGMWVTETQIEELGAVNQSTVNRNIEAFEQIDLVDSRGSHPREYRLNEDFPAVGPLSEAHRELHASLTQLADEGEKVESPFYALLKSRGRVELVDTLLDNRGLWVTTAQLNDRAPIHQTTVDRRIGEFMDAGLVESKGSQPTQYRLDEDHPAVEPLATAHRELHRLTSTLVEMSWEVDVPTAESTRSKITEQIDTALGAVVENAEQTVTQQIDETTIVHQLRNELVEETLEDSSSDGSGKIDITESGEIGFRDPGQDKRNAAARISRATA